MAVKPQRKSPVWSEENCRKFLEWYDSGDFTARELRIKAAREFGAVIGSNDGVGAAARFVAQKLGVPTSGRARKQIKAKSERAPPSPKNPNPTTPRT